MKQQAVKASCSARSGAFVCGKSTPLWVDFARAPTISSRLPVGLERGIIRRWPIAFVSSPALQIIWRARRRSNNGVSHANCNSSLSRVHDPQDRKRRLMMAHPRYLMLGNYDPGFIPTFLDTDGGGRR